MKNSANPLNRRQFVRQSACAALGLTGMVNTLAHLKLINAALAQSAPPDYKALVVLFLFGGNDSNNMLMPQMSHAEYNNYKSARGILKIFDPADPAKLATDPASIALTSPDGDFGVHPNMNPIAGLFNSGDLAFVANTGSLSYPITRAQYIAGSVPKPPQLFSHSDQQLQWQSSLPDRPFTTGWGGRVADLLSVPSSGSVSMSVSLSGINSLQVGNDVAQYAVSSSGAISFAGYDSTGPGAYDLALNTDGTYTTSYHGKRFQAFEDVMRYTHTHLLEEGYNDVVRRARANEGLIGAALTAAAASGVNFDTMFPDRNATTTGVQNTSLDLQLKMIAKLIAGRTALGNSRQIFFCSVGGYDTHQNQLSAHATLMTELSDALKSFKDTMVALGVHDNVLTVTHSDFTRTLTPNGTDTAAGSDHGWGGHQIVMGGAVKTKAGGGATGGRIYGTFPSLVVGNNQDVDANRGRWIPTSSVDQYAAVAAKWLGVSSTALATIFPNLGRFPDPFLASTNLAYV